MLPNLTIGIFVYLEVRLAGRLEVIAARLFRGKRKSFTTEPVVKVVGISENQGNLNILLKWLFDVRYQTARSPERL